MKILVTGSDGLIGRAICSDLERRGHDVIGLRNYGKKECQSLAYQVNEADISNRESLKMLSDSVSACDAIVHAAAALDKELYDTAVPLVNCLGTQNVLWLADRWKCTSFVYISGVSVIGRPIHNPITESHPVEPASAYLASKFFGEQLVRLSGAQAMSSATLRVSAPVGSRMPMNRLLTTVIRRALSDQIVELSGKGARLQNYVDVRDVARAAALCVEKNVSGLFNIAGSKSISNYDLASRCIELCKSASRIEFSNPHDGEDECQWVVSIEKASRVFGYSPKHHINNSINAVIAACSDKVN